MSDRCVLFFYCSPVTQALGFISFGVGGRLYIITKQNKLECVFLAQCSCNRSCRRKVTSHFLQYTTANSFLTWMLTFLTWPHFLGPVQLSSLPLRREAGSQSLRKALLFSALWFLGCSTNQHQPDQQPPLTQLLHSNRSDDLVRQTDQFFDWIDYSFHLPLTMIHLEPQGSEPPWRRRA